MIDFDYAEQLNILVLLAGIAVLIIQLWFLVLKNKGPFTARTAIRLSLNVLLWLAVMAFILQPVLPRKNISKTGLVVGNDVAGRDKKTISDSLRKAEILNFPSLEDMESLDTLILAGQHFDADLFKNISIAKNHPVLKWLPFQKVNELRNLSWKGVLRKGEMQNIRGRIKSDADQTLRIRYGSQTLDSMVLKAGSNAFALDFPVFNEGRTAIDLLLGDKTVDTIHFFARPAESFSFRFILDNPDFESRNLASFLGKMGHSVLYDTKLSRDLASELNINKAKDPDIIITDPANASNSLVKKALGLGKSILFINVSNPVAEINGVNLRTGSKFGIRRTSDQETVPVSNELTALPFAFIASNQYQSNPNYPVALARGKGKVAVSLLNETFPMMLTGDSIAYQKVWNTIIAFINTPTNANVDVPAPIYSGIKARVSLNNFTARPTLYQIGNDSVFLDYSAINSNASGGTFVPKKVGWITTADSLGVDIFVENELASNSNFNEVRLRNFLTSYNSILSKLEQSAAPTATLAALHTGRKVQPWTWFGWVIFFLAAVWVESKL